MQLPLPDAGLACRVKGRGLALEMKSVFLQVAGHILPRHAIDVHHAQDRLGDSILQPLQTGPNPSTRCCRLLDRSSTCTNRQS